jgi:hypothetical protein
MRVIPRSQPAMVFCGADFLVSKAPAAPVAIQAAAKKAVNDAAKKTSSLRDFAAELQTRLVPSLGEGWHILVGGDFAVDLRYVRALRFPYSRTRVRALI